MRHLTCGPNAEIRGATVMSLLDNLSADQIQDILEKHGLVDIQPETWYPCQQLLDYFNELSQIGGYLNSSALVAAGMKVAEYQAVPPEMENAPLGQMLEMWDEVYHTNHRGDVGGIVVEKVNDTHYKCIHNNIYPDDLHYGVAYGMARRYLEPGTRFTVSYDDDIPALDRGGDQTIIHVKW